MAPESESPQVAPITVDAELRNAFVVRTFSGEFLFIGDIYNDSRKRFRDGESVRTSAVREHIAPDLFRTRNTLYRVVFDLHITWEGSPYKDFMEKFHYVK